MFISFSSSRGEKAWGEGGADHLFAERGGRKALSDCLPNSLRSSLVFLPDVRRGEKKTAPGTAILRGGRICLLEEKKESPVPLVLLYFFLEEGDIRGKKEWIQDLPPLFLKEKGVRRIPFPCRKGCPEGEARDSGRYTEGEENSTDSDCSYRFGRGDHTQRKRGRRRKHLVDLSENGGRERRQAEVAHD